MRHIFEIYILLVTVIIKVSCDCGILTSSENSSISLRHGSEIEDQIFPWCVLIYKTQSNNKPSCAGTLISTEIVITAAHCCYDDISMEKYDASEFSVAAGKHYIPLNWREGNVQVSSVRNIHIASGYEGIIGSYEKDVAWLVLENPFIITPFVKPVCMDFDNTIDGEELLTGDIGKSLFWASKSSDNPIKTLRQMEYSVISDDDCNSKLRESYRFDKTSAKFCANSRNGNVHDTNRGAGLFTQSNGRWYLRGIFSMSLVLAQDSQENAYHLLTNVRGFVNEMTKITEIKKCGIAGPPANSLIVNGLRAERGGFPWHVAVYEKNSTGTYDQICSGSMISSNIVVSAAHCFYDSTRRQKLDASNYAVAAGKQYRPYNWPERFVQKSAIKIIHIPDRYYGLDGLYAEDIAWLILERHFNVSMFVRPICIDLDNSHERGDLRSGSVGKAAGWGLTADGSTSLELQEMSVPFVHHETCVSAFPRDFVPFVTADKFCGGHLNGTSLCDGDSGGGLAFQRDGRWYLRGIVSASPRIRGVCNSHLYTVFTNVGRYMEELQRLTNFTTRDLI